MSKYSGIIGFTGFISVLAAASVKFVLGDGPWVMGLSGAGAVLLFLYAFVERDGVERRVESRAFSRSALAATQLLVAGLIGLGLIQLSVKHERRWDWTRSDRFSLSEQSQRVARNAVETEVYAFFATGSFEERRFRTLVSGYTIANPAIAVHFVDPMRDPLLAKRFKVSSEYGTVVLVKGDRRQRLESDFDEVALTNGLMKLENSVEHALCWVMGHGELSPDDDQRPMGLGAIVLLVEELNYTLKTIRPATDGFSRDCEALIVAAPTQDWLAYEREGLAAYLAEGGRAFFLFEPMDGVDPAGGLIEEFERYGLSVKNDLILEGDPALQLPERGPYVVPVFSETYGAHPITKGLTAMAVFDMSRSVTLLDPQPGLRGTMLFQASELSWGESDMNGTDVGPNPEFERVSNVGIAAAVEISDPSVIQVAEPSSSEALISINKSAAFDEAFGVPSDFSPKAGGRLVLFGDVDFATNQWMSTGNNRDIFLNSLAWLVGEDDQLGQRPEIEPDFLTLTEVQLLLLWLISVFLVPGAALGLAIGMGLRRRWL